MRFKFDIDKIFKKINLINEYNYYMPSKNSNINEVDEETSDDENTQSNDSEESLDDTESLDSQSNDTEDSTDSGDISADELGLGSLDSQEMGATGSTAAVGSEMDDIGGIDDMGDTSGDVEIDVSELVDNIDQNAQKIDDVNQKIDSISNDISSKFDDFTNKILKFSSDITNKINGLQTNIGNELKKRNPTPNEQLQMQSMKSYPYSQKLTDYWKPVNNQIANQENQNAWGNVNGDAFEVKKNNTQDTEDEPKYKITQADIDRPISDYFINDTF